MEHRTLDNGGVAVNYVVLTNEDLNGLCNQEKRFKKVLKDYTGEVAVLEISDKTMLLPNIPEIIRKVDFIWCFAVFGTKGNTPFEKIIISEINKCLAGKIYSVSKLASAMEQ